jgi:hypothetical protein
LACFFQFYPFVIRGVKKNSGSFKPCLKFLKRLMIRHITHRSILYFSAIYAHFKTPVASDFVSGVPGFDKAGFTALFPQNLSYNMIQRDRAIGAGVVGINAVIPEGNKFISSGNPGTTFHRDFPLGSNKNNHIPHPGAGPPEEIPVGQGKA